MRVQVRTGARTLVPRRGGFRPLHPPGFRNFRIQKTEAQHSGQRAGDPKPPEVVPVFWEAPVPEAATEDEGVVTEPRAAPQHAPPSIAGHVIRPGVVRQTPFPHIACHVHHPKRTVPLSFVLPHRRRPVTVVWADRVIKARAVPVIPPRVFPAVIALRRPLPLLFGREHDRLAAHLAQPQAERHRLIPRHPHHRVVCTIPFRVLPIARLRPVFCFARASIPLPSTTFSAR
jgi:hypothetical protein